MSWTLYSLPSCSSTLTLPRQVYLTNIITCRYSRTPLIRTLVVWIANYPDRLRPSGKFVDNCTKLACLEITGYRIKYRGVDKSLARPGRTQARKHVRDSRDFNSIETRTVIKFPPPPFKARRRRKFAPFWRTLNCFFPGRAKYLSAPLYSKVLRLLELHIRQGRKVETQVHTVSSNSQTSNCQCSVFSTKKIQSSVFSTYPNSWPFQLTL